MYRRKPNAGFKALQSALAHISAEIAADVKTRINRLAKGTAP
jgi:hypothetical protein